MTIAEFTMESLRLRSNAWKCLHSLLENDPALCGFRTVGDVRDYIIKQGKDMEKAFQKMERTIPESEAV
jgi:hypothetical protein